jgi:hypothetical protein
MMLTFRSADEGDCGLILRFIRELADYESLLGEVVATEELARIAVSRGCGRLEWWCLDRNTPSVEFYLSLGAEPMSDWTVYRIAGERLREMGKER